MNTDDTDGQRKRRATWWESHGDLVKLAAFTILWMLLVWAAPVSFAEYLRGPQ